MIPAKLDDRDAVMEAMEHVVELWRTCVIAGRRSRFHELLERGLDQREALNDLYAEAFGPRPPGAPFQDMITHLNPWNWSEDWRDDGE